MGRPAISDWRAGLKSKTRIADLDSFLRNMVKIPEWSYPDLGGLSGKSLKGLKELRWRSDGVPHRIGGYFSAPDEFIMLIGWTHNQKKWDPPGALDTLAERRQKIMFAKEATLREYKIITNR
jgi:hypothetical protein